MLRIILSMVKNLEKIAKQKKIKYFLVTFVDLFGVQRAKLVPTRAIGEMQKTGAGFGGFATHLDLSFSEPDMFALPDPESLIQLPWQPDVGWLASDLVMNNKLMDQCPRVILKNQIENLDKLDLTMKTGVECEFFILNEDGSEVADTRDDALKPCYDVAALMRRFDVLSEICDSMIKLGWKPYQNDHEDANGQFEMNWDYTDCLTTADRHVFFKFMVKSIAEKHGLRATFMPKPFTQLTGNGCHAHVSIWDKKKKKNLFHDTSDKLGLSKMGYQFIGGIMKSVDSFAAWLNPCLNSYERLNAKTTNSGSTYSPTAVTYSGNNRTHMIRIPDEGRFEFRAADGAVNPYLLQSGIIAMGLDGIKNKRSPGKRLDINMYTQGHKLKRVKKLPKSLEHAIKKFSNDAVVKKSIGAKVVSKYVKLKRRELNEFSQVGEANKISWVRKNIIDC
jgi:glutamine synthetase type III